MAGAPRKTLRTPRRAPRPDRAARSARRVERRWAMLFATPYLAHLVLLTAWPVLALAYLGFTDYDTVSSPRWTGLDNYSRLLGDEAFWTSLLNTGYFALIFVPLQTVVALALAVALNQKLRFMPLLRGAYFVPVVSSWVVMAYVADAVFNPRLGSANAVLDWFGIDPLTWLDSPVLVIPTLALIAVWKGAGYMMVLFLAALQAIPQERYEAARVDGAGAWGRFRHITVPGVSGTTFLVLVLSTITTLQAFEQVFVMTGGGPGDASELTVLYMYRQGFEYFQMGYAAAIAWVLFAVILVLTLIQLRLQKRWVHYA
ncbi:carbohydrate ABC transporter permease [Streptomyces sp. N35]|uniref:carbohydrate ABC transporter permease n=1 Tax=Streptomyces sp. N35 TaxID=2795730 RepID=UPI0018F3BB77|nr:sugar ABC transporter permease [Streptomyces sp. N35]